MKDYFISTLKSMETKNIIDFAKIVIIAFLSAAIVDRIILVGLNDILKYIADLLWYFDSANGTAYHTFTIFRYFKNIEIFSLPRIYFISIFIGLFLIIKHLGVNRACKYRYVLAAILLVALVLGKFTGSSLGFYDGMLLDNTDSYECSTLLGVPQGLRGDEWATEKPYYFAQQSNEYSYYNSNLMFEGCDMVISAFAPVKDLLIIARPDLWGFLILPADYAFSFYWNFRILALFMASFEMMFFLTKKISFSIVWALALCFAPPIQWWLSQVLMIIIWSGEYFIVTVNKLLICNSKRKKLVYTLLASWFAVIYVLTMYPATQVPMGYIFLALLVYVFYINKDIVFERSNMFSFIGIISFLIVFLLYFYLNSSTAMSTLLNTTYPGASRNWISLDWDYEFLKFLNPIMWCTYLPILNNCEASQFYSFTPFVIIAFGYIYNRLEKTDKVLLLGLFIVSCSLSLVAYIPEIPLLNKLTLLSFSYPVRILFASGFGFMLMLFLILSKNIDSIYSCNKRNILINFSCIGILILALNSELLNSFFNNKQLATISITLFVAIYITMGSLLLNSNQQRTKIFLTLYLLLSIFSTAFVNPITYGTDSMFEKKVMQEVRILNSQDPGRWMVSGNSTISNLVTAQGVARTSGTYYYPDWAMMEIIDPKREHLNMWNQYAHIDMRLRNGVNEFTRYDYENNVQYSAIDLIIYVDIETARKLDVKYILTKFSVPNEYLLSGELTKIYTNSIDNWSIYKLVD